MSELPAIEEVITQYFKGLHQGDAGLLRQVFLPGAVICGYYEGELVNVELPGYLHILRNMSAPERIGEEFDMSLSAIDVIGNTASVRTKYLFEALNYVDHLSLVKINGDWKIVSKVFHHD